MSRDPSPEAVEPRPLSESDFEAHKGTDHYEWQTWHVERLLATVREASSLKAQLTETEERLRQEHDLVKRLGAEQRAAQQKLDEQAAELAKARAAETRIRGFLYIMEEALDVRVRADRISGQPDEDDERLVRDARALIDAVDLGRTTTTAIDFIPKSEVDSLRAELAAADRSEATLAKAEARAIEAEAQLSAEKERAERAEGTCDHYKGQISDVLQHLYLRRGHSTTHLRTEPWQAVEEVTDALDAAEKRAEALAVALTTLKANVAQYMRAAPHLGPAAESLAWALQQSEAALLQKKGTP